LNSQVGGKTGERKVYCHGFSLPCQLLFEYFLPNDHLSFSCAETLRGGDEEEEFSGLRIFTLAAVHTVYNHYYLCRLNPQLLKRSHKELLLPSLIFICIRWQMKTFQFLMSSWLSSALE